jgi:hypothetical protein
MSDPNEPAVRGPAWLSNVMAAYSQPWCLLRDAPHAPADDTDLDLLIAPVGREELEAHLGRLGFGRLVRPGRGSHRFWVKYDPVTDSWPKVDVVTRLCYGPHQEICTDIGPEVLQRRSASAPGIWGPAPSDAFWLLILHALLDKGTVLERHRERLLALAPFAEPGDPPARVLADLESITASPSELLDDVRAERWEALARRVPQLRAALRRRDWPWAHAAALRHRAQRRAGRHGIWPLAAGLTVEVRGGTSAQRRALIDELRGRLPVETRSLRRAARRSGPAEAVRRLRTRLAVRGGRIAFIDSVMPATASQAPVPRHGSDLVISLDDDLAHQPHGSTRREWLDRIWSRYRARQNAAAGAGADSR